MLDYLVLLLLAVLCIAMFIVIPAWFACTAWEDWARRVPVVVLGVGVTGVLLWMAASFV